MQIIAAFSQCGIVSTSFRLTVQGNTRAAYRLIGGKVSRRRSSKVLRLYRSVSLLAVLVFAASFASANTIYSFQGTGAHSGDSFQYTSPNPVGTATYLKLSLSDLDSYTGVFDNATLGAVNFNFARSGGFSSIGVTISPFEQDYFYFANAAFSSPGVYASGLLDSNSGVLTVTDTARVPEPSSILLLGSGLVGFAGFFRRKLIR